jgi:threonine synthase
MASFVTNLESAIDGTRLEARVPQRMHAGRPLWVRYNLEAVGRALRRNMLKDREPTLWRYREMLPVDEESSIVTLGETMTPLLPCPALGNAVGVPNLLVKDESRLPTGSFKSRGQTVAISMCKQFGIKRVAIPTAGNAGGAMAAYAARAGMEAYVFMPRDTPVINQAEAVLAGAKVFLVDGLINDCGKIVNAGLDAMGWFDISTLKEPYRVEGKKTMGIELAEQMKWKLPDVILYPTGGGTGLIGMWKAFDELKKLGWLETEKLPRMVAVQSQGCAPIVRAYENNERFAEPFPEAYTIASGLRVPAAVGDFMILDAVRASKGNAVAVEEGFIVDWMKLGTSKEGIGFCPESATCIGAAQFLARSGWIRPEETVVLFNCGAAQKYPHTVQLNLPVVEDAGSVDWDWLRRQHS